MSFAMAAFGDVLGRLGYRELAGKLPWSGHDLPVAHGPDRTLGQAAARKSLCR